MRAQTHLPPIDDAIVVQNNFESTFFGFRYEFPAEWHALADITRIADNKERYDKQLKQALTKNGPNTPNNKTEVFPNYNLLVAGPSPVGMSDTPQMPRIVIWVHKRFDMLDKPGDHPKILSMTIPNLTVLHPPEETTLAGQRFIRADYSFDKESYLSQWVTQMGDYLIGFDLRARTKDELKGLSQTMQTLQFVSNDSAPISKQDEPELSVAGVSGNSQAAKLVEHVVPVYPPLARQARISGTVRLHAILAKDGTVKSLEVISGHPLLIQAAIDAVRKWRYAPTLINGRRVEVDTTIDVVFGLDEKPI